jgi:hypothetical protein
VAATHHQPVGVQLLVIAQPHARDRVPGRALKVLGDVRALVGLVLLVHVAAVVHAPEEAPVDGRLAHHQRVLLVVPRIARNRLPPPPSPPQSANPPAHQHVPRWR